MVKTYTKHSVALKQRAVSSLRLDSGSNEQKDAQSENSCTSTQFLALETSKKNSGLPSHVNLDVDGEEKQETAFSRSSNTLVFHESNVMIMDIDRSSSQLPSFRDFGPLPIAEYVQQREENLKLPEKEPIEIDKDNSKEQSMEMPSQEYNEQEGSFEVKPTSIAVNKIKQCAGMRARANRTKKE